MSGMAKRFRSSYFPSVFLRCFSGLKLETPRPGSEVYDVYVMLIALSKSHVAIYNPNADYTNQSYVYIYMYIYILCVCPGLVINLLF